MMLRENNKGIIDTYFRPERVVPSDRWPPGRCALRSADDDGNTAMAEKVDCSKHASLASPLSELGMKGSRTDDDVESLQKHQQSVVVRKS